MATDHPLSNNKLIDDFIIDKNTNGAMKLVRNSTINDLGIDKQDQEGNNLLGRLILNEMSTVVILLLNKFGDELPLEHLNNDEEHILYLAVRYNCDSLVITLLNDYHTYFNPYHLNRYRQSIFGLVCEETYRDIVIHKFLDVYDGKCMPEHIQNWPSGKTAIYDLIDNERPELASRLLNEYGYDCKVDLINWRGISAFDRAIHKRYYLLVEQMLEYIDDNYNHRVSDEFDTPLMYLVADNQYNLIEQFLNKFGIYLNISAVNSEGKTAFMIACEKGYFDIAKFLSDKGYDAIIIHQMDHNCETAFMKICKYNTLLTIEKRRQRIDLVKDFMGTSGHSKKLLLDLTDEEGNDPLMIVCKYGNDDIANLLLTSAGPLNIGRTNYKGYTAAIYACINKLPSVVSLILANSNYSKMLLEKETDSKESLLTTAFENEMYDLCQTIISKIHPVTYEYLDNTIKYACQNGNVPLLSMLIDNFSYALLYDNCNYCIPHYLNIAAYNDHINIIDFLVEQYGEEQLSATCSCVKQHDYVLFTFADRNKIDIAEKLIDKYGLNCFMPNSVGYDSYLFERVCSEEPNNVRLLNKIADMLFSEYPPCCFCDYCGNGNEDDYSYYTGCHPFKELVFSKNEDLMVKLLNKHGDKCLNHYTKNEWLEFAFENNLPKFFTKLIEIWKDTFPLSGTYELKYDRDRDDFFNRLLKSNGIYFNSNWLICALERGWNDIISNYLPLFLYEPKVLFEPNIKQENAINICIRNNNDRVATEIIQYYNNYFKTTGLLEKTICINSLFKTSIFNNFKDLPITIINLFPNKVNVNQILLNDVRTIVSIACEQSLENLAIKIIETYKEDCYPFLKDSSSKTPLQIAQEKGLTQFIIHFKETFGKDHTSVQHYSMEYITCIICHDDTAQNIQLNPCEHKNLCPDCVKRIPKCPLCRADIQSQTELEPNITIYDS